MSHRVVVAMSGGVDSSVAAALMVEAGFEVIGMTLQLYDQGMASGKKGACCAGQDIYDARKDPDQFLNLFQSPLILDEGQFAPELLASLKRKVDAWFCMPERRPIRLIKGRWLFLGKLY